VTCTSLQGNVLAWSSAGACGFKGARKKTPLAAKQAAENAAGTCLSQGMKEISVRIKGAGAGREAALRGLRDAGLTISIIRDITPIPHNGCRPPKRRRV
jgi:small subunit ribosomal protein S11